MVSEKEAKLALINATLKLVKKALKAGKEEDKPILNNLEAALNGVKDVVKKDKNIHRCTK